MRLRPWSLALVALPLVALLVMLIRTPSKLAVEGNAAGAHKGDAVSREMAGAAERLAGAIRFVTIAKSEADDEAVGTDAFGAFQQYLRRCFPAAFAALEPIETGTRSMLFRWPGIDQAAQPRLLMAHQDVVSAQGGPAESWTHPPFSGTIADGFIWGRGTLDDKAALLAILEAADDFARRGQRPARTLFLFFGHDEETGGHDGAARVSEQLKAQGVRFEFVLDEGTAVIRKPFPGAHSDLLMIGVAQKGYATLRLTAVARGGHASMPPKELAVNILSTALERLFAEPFPADTRFAAPMLNAFAPELGFGQRFAIGNLGLFEPFVIRTMSNRPAQNALLRTTLAPTMLAGSDKENVLPRTATVTVNARIFPGSSIADVVSEAARRISDARVTIELSPFQSEPSRVSSTQSPGFSALTESASKAMGNIPTRIVPGLIVAATDARYFAPLAADVYGLNLCRLSQDDLPSIHGIDEKLSITEYSRMIEFYKHLIATP